MANRWGIPNSVELIVTARDANCVYCGIELNRLSTNRKTKPTWEHIINDIKINGIENIALCCGSCNSSKGNKTLNEWLKSKYCKEKGINENTVAPVVQKHLLASSK